MSALLDVATLTLFVLAASIWVGGLVTLVVVSRVTNRTLSTADRVATFRGIGRVYGPLGGAALLVALVLGLVLTLAQPAGVVFWLACVVALCLLAVTVIGMIQARAMTRLRWAARHEQAGGETSQRIARAGRRAAVLRAGIGFLTLVLVVLGSTLALATA